MFTKLTLRLDSTIIARAKSYAKNQNTSLSKMIESYLDSLTKSDNSDVEITPLVKSLSGVIELPEDYDYREDYTDFLIRKYK